MFSISVKYFLLLIAVDEQNAQTLQFELENANHQLSPNGSCPKSVSPKANRPEPLVLPQVIEPNDAADSAVSPPPSVTALETTQKSFVIPTITTVDMTTGDDDVDVLMSPYAIDFPPPMTPIDGLVSSSSHMMASLAVPGYTPSLYSSSDGESSACSTPGFLSPGQMSPGLFSSESVSQSLYSPVDCQSSFFDRGRVPC